jgi:hypothetical protein
MNEKDRNHVIKGILLMLPLPLFAFYSSQYQDIIFFIFYMECNAAFLYGIGQLLTGIFSGPEKEEKVYFTKEELDRMLEMQRDIIRREIENREKELDE